MSRKQNSQQTVAVHPEKQSGCMPLCPPAAPANSKDHVLHLVLGVHALELRQDTRARIRPSAACLEHFEAASRQHDENGRQTLCAYHRRVLKHVWHNDEADAAATDVDVLHLGHLRASKAEDAQQAQRGQLPAQKRLSLAAAYGAVLQSCGPACCTSAAGFAPPPAACYIQIGCQRTLPSRAVACTLMSCTFQQSSASCSSPR